MITREQIETALDSETKESFVTKDIDHEYKYEMWNKGWDGIRFVVPEQYKVGDTLYFTTTKPVK